MSAAEITGVDAVFAGLRAVPGAVQEGLARALTRLSFELQSAARDKLSGSVLQSRTGALRGSIAATLSSTGSGIALSIGSDLPYAGFQEYGFQGVETVSAHLRTIKQAFGRPLRAGAERIAVGSYSRRVDYPAHSFLRSALSELQPEIAGALDAAVAEAVRP
jgi:hypothetical protein